MREFNESFHDHVEEIMAAWDGDEKMRDKHPHYEQQYQQLRQLFRP